MFSSNTSQVSGAANYIEDVFSTYLYTGNGSTQTINNGIDVTGLGGLIWMKERSSTGFGHFLIDTARGNATASKARSLSTENTSAQNSIDAIPTSSGFNLTGSSGVNFNAATYASWTFREQAKFYTQKQISHTNGTSTNIDLSTLGTVGYLHAKITNTTGDWIVWHRSLTAGNNLRLNSAGAQSTINARLSVSGTTATLSASAPTGTYIIHAFAHDAGGFGLSGTDNVISCGSYTGGSGIINVTLGWEPQWIMRKRSNGTSNWEIVDNMRGMPNTNGATASQTLFPNLSNAESATAYLFPTATGFSDANSSSTETYIYIAIRRGPMKTPTSGTSVYSASWFQDGNTQTETNFPVDLAIEKYGYKNDSQVNVTGNNWFYDRLRGVNALLVSNTTAAETSSKPVFYVSGFDSNTTLKVASSNITGSYGMFWNVRRAPGFFDEVCYTGTGSNLTLPHNLTVAPELWIVKKRTAGAWAVGTTKLLATEYLFLNTTAAKDTAATLWNSSYPTSTSLYIGTSSSVNTSAEAGIAYLFASCPGVSKVGSYTGTGTTQTINCGFTAGARFVMIKRTDSTGDWLVWDSARGIVASPGNSPSLALNTTAAEVSNFNIIIPASSGFGIGPTSFASVNASGGTYIFLAIA